MGKIFLYLVVLIPFSQCNKKEELNLLAPHKKFIDHVIGKDNSFYSTKGPLNPKLRKSLSIGVFDSGTGGLTVLDAIINADFFNLDHVNHPDGVKDFEHEQFIYLADQANMPYSNYVEEGNKELLVEHVLKDALFLLNTKYHTSANGLDVAENKPAVKAIVIACNTATAYGKSHVEELCRVTGHDVRVIGVIDAGCKGALEVIEEDEDATIAIFATPATISSLAYVKTLIGLSENHPGKIRTFQQGGKGLHESIDKKPEFINSTYTKPYAEYQGPSLSSGQYRIQKHLFPYYNFDTSNFRILYNKDKLEISDIIEINSVENYTRYHIVSLVEQLKGKGDTIPLKAIVLGCTHYPYVSNIIHNVLEELRETGRYDYLLADSVYLIDPALNLAKELYEYLAEQELFNDPGEYRAGASRFFMSVPNTFEPEVKTATDNRFTYDYQYKNREINELKDFTLIVPFAWELISSEQMAMIQTKLPSTYEIIKNSIDSKTE